MTGCTTPASPFSSSGNGETLVWGTMMEFSLILLFAPFIPGLRSIPRKRRIHRLIWREHYRDSGRA